MYSIKEHQIHLQIGAIKIKHQTQNQLMLRLHTVLLLLIIIN